MLPVHFRWVLDVRCRVVVAKRANNVAAMLLKCSVGNRCVGTERLLGE